MSLHLYIKDKVVLRTGETSSEKSFISSGKMFHGKSFIISVRENWKRKLLKVVAVLEKGKSSKGRRAKVENMSKCTCNKQKYMSAPA